MPSFALHPINRITRSISSPNPIASHHQTKVVSAIPTTRPRNGDHPPTHLTHNLHIPFPPSLEEQHPQTPIPHSSDSFTTATAQQHQPAQTQKSTHPNPPAMPRLNPLSFISSITASSSSQDHAEQNKPPSPVSSSSASSGRDSLPLPSAFSPSSSYNAHLTSHHHTRNHYSHQQSTRAVTDLPPVSPMSSMYDPYSPELSAESSGASDDDSATSTPLSSSTASDSLDGNVFLRPRSTPCNRVSRNDIRPSLPTPNPSSSRAQDRDLGPPVAFRRAVFETPASPARSPKPTQFSSHSRESLFAGIAARGKVVDAFVANRHVPDVTNPDDNYHSVQGMSRVMSGKSLEIPRGKLEQLPVPRPVTPCQPPRPETPSRLPRPRVFIRPSPSRQSVVDPVAVTQDPEMGPGEAEFVTREVPRPITPSPGFTRNISEVPISSTKAHPVQEDFYFSDEEHVEDDVSGYRHDPYTTGAATPSDMFSYKVRRAVSALRSISFQSHNLDDIETAWGQANSLDPGRERMRASSASSRWRRACGRISSKNGVQEYDCMSEVDAHSINSYTSNLSMQRDRAASSREHLRGVIGVPLRRDHGSRLRRSLWTGGKRDRQPPQTRAAELLFVNDQGLLAASADPYDNSNALATVSPTESMELSSLTRGNGRRCSVDKYVEFVHASAQRETRNRSHYRTLRSRIVNRMFRRRWN